MDAFLDTNVDGLLLMLWTMLGLLAFLAVAGIVQAWMERPRKPTKRIVRVVDFARCERAGSQKEFIRRMRAVGK